jgi:LmbE family N-acetylglucosaminyl deacetylase
MQKIKDFVKNNSRLLIIVFGCIIVLLIGCIIYYKKTYTIHPDITKINLKGTKKLMIVAHPDDEILWGGKELIEDDYLVVCVTCGTRAKRVFEFVKAMHATGDKYIMLGYPDKTNGQRDNWDTVYKDINKDLKDIIDLKDWDLIVVHNPDGEYGHQHHKMLNVMVTDTVTNKKKLYYFGHYYSKKSIGKHYNELTPMKESTLTKKKQIIGIYHSQKFIQTAFDQMFPYENWLTYEEWMSEQNEKA